jgi:hypothetical protein
MAVEGVKHGNIETVFFFYQVVELCEQLFRTIVENKFIDLFKISLPALKPK